MVFFDFFSRFFFLLPFTDIFKISIQHRLVQVAAMWQFTVQRSKSVSNTCNCQQTPSYSIHTKTSIIALRTVKVNFSRFFTSSFHFLISFLSKLHFSPHRRDPPTVSFPLRPRAAQNRGHPGCDHRQLHCRVWAIPPRWWIQICVPVAG